PQLLTLSNRVEVWSLRNLRIARRFQWRSFQNAPLRRRFKALTLDPTLENETDRLQLSELHQSLQNSYSHIAACPKLGNNSAAGCLPVGEQAVSDVLANASASYDYKLSVWRSWYDSAAGAMATNFTAYVRLANSSARQIGYGDFGEADWRSTSSRTASTRTCWPGTPSCPTCTPSCRPTCGTGCRAGTRGNSGRTAACRRTSSATTSGLSSGASSPRISRAAWQP
ncbi:hypothetical protein BOX15_Mlig032609g1, partial [Macrostomum lignano]